MAGRRAFTLLEVLVALVVVATGLVALERLGADSLRSLAGERAAAEAQLAAQRMLTEARFGPLPLGRIAGADDRGVAFERVVEPTEHPGVRLVRVRTRVGTGAGGSCELMEWIRVPPG